MSNASEGVKLVASGSAASSRPSRRVATAVARRESCKMRSNALQKPRAVGLLVSYKPLAYLGRDAAFLRRAAIPGSKDLVLPAPQVPRRASVQRQAAPLTTQRELGQPLPSHLADAGPQIKKPQHRCPSSTPPSRRASRSGPTS